MRPRVLIIDDEIGITRALAVRLQAAGFDTEVANNGTLGVACATARRPEVILLDIRMPDIDGYEVNRRLKSAPELASVPVVFLSANVQDTARQAALSAGAVAYLTKPYDYRQVLDAIRSNIGACQP
jgi:two-component system, cell cycle response regulator DivK